MKNLDSLNSERESLLDYVRSCSDKYGGCFAEQLIHIERVLHENVVTLAVGINKSVNY